MSVKGNNRAKLSLRGKHRGERLAARIRGWMTMTTNGTQYTTAYHKPGSRKK